MTTQNDGIAIVLANRHYLYGLLQHVFGHEPSFELIEIALSEHTQNALKLVLDEEQDKLGDYLLVLKKLEQSFSADRRGTLDKLKSEYTYLMLGPNKLPAPPWESVYLTEERMIFQESTLKVRQAYLNYQFLPAKYPHEADDHIALELDFMAHLAQLALQRFEEEKFEEVKKLLIDQREFLARHLLLWISGFAAQIQASRTHLLYPAVAALTERVLKRDATVLDELITLL
ncbi:TorD/DmsD family molecular chaperone [Desulfosporosinus youngiae]|uniref:Putative component of anaerobic dehydrogenase n=1 Tax=Desulfosporosinus youngiae DSM 17734 TaxID=768710 RepID=H5XXZ8_9FIRM|nr:molecular chaperone TorD family protein [Desulfosporosinus youngiae]EHQ91501.1 putative component of anaerobic dehydrogenase [Desulfosporosinus youngiae DSM 17734]